MRSRPVIMITAVLMALLAVACGGGETSSDAEGADLAELFESALDDEPPGEDDPAPAVDDSEDGDATAGDDEGEGEGDGDGDRPDGTPMVDLPTGRLVFDSDRSGNLDLWLLESGSSQPRQLTTDPSSDRTAAFTPDGSAVVFQSDRDSSADSPTGLRSYAIYRLDLDGGEATHLLGGRSFNSGPALSPDGAVLSFSSDASGDLHVYFAEPDGSSPTQVTRENRSNGGPVWSPDGATAVYSTRSGSADDWDLWLMDGDGENRRPLLDGPDSDRSADWSPDGSRLVFQSDRGGEEGVYDLYVLDLETEELTPLTSGSANDQYPSWSPDGRYVAFDSDRDAASGASIYVVEVDTGEVSRITDGERDGFPDWGE